MQNPEHVRAETQRILALLQKLPGPQATDLALAAAARRGPSSAACILYLLTEAAAAKQGLSWLVAPVMEAAAEGRHGLTRRDLLRAALRGRAAHRDAAIAAIDDDACFPDAMERFRDAKVVVHALTVGWLHALACHQKTTVTDAVHFLQEWHDALHAATGAQVTVAEFADVYAYQAVLTAYSADTPAEAEARLAHWCGVPEAARRRTAGP